MKKTLKLISLALVFAIVLPILCACGEGDNSSKSEGGGTYDVIDKVPDEVDFQGEKFTVLCRESNAWGDYGHEIKADENETDIVNQAIYNRNLAVEERLNVSYEPYLIPGQWAVKDDFINTFKNSVLAGDGAFDLIMSQAAYMSELALTELYLNWNEVPYVNEDMNAAYFYQDEVNEMTVNNKLYFMLSDYSLTYWENLFVLYFNKQIAENENVEDLYALVKNGEWTVDKLIEISKGVYGDVNGNGYVDEGDRFGYITDYPNTTDALFSHFDCEPTSKDASGNVTLSIDQGKMVSILEKMIAFFSTDDVYTYYSYSEQTEEDTPFNTMFTEDRALFYPERLNRAQRYRGMETDFGIIPYPKWDANQAGYYTQAQDGYSVAVVPMDAKNTELTGAVYDVISAISYQEVIPAYYDVSLKDKYARDDESGEMLDIIREGTKVNFGYFYCNTLGIAGILRLLLSQENSNFVSYYAANQKGYERNLKKILKTYEDSAEQ